MISLIKKMYSKVIVKAFYPVIHRISETSAVQIKPEYLVLMERACKTGFEYHQKMVKNNPDLLKWVIKDNYLDED